MTTIVRTAVEVLDDAARRTPAMAASLPAREAEMIARGKGTLTTGIPRFTWNGLDARTGQLFPGVHPATAGEAELRYAFNGKREQMFDRMRQTLAALRQDDPDLRYVVGGGSFFSGKPDPGDVDLTVLSDELHMLDAQALNRRNPVVHVYPANPTFAGIPQRSFVDFFRFNRDESERGVVLLDLDDVLGPAGASS